MLDDAIFMRYSRQLLLEEIGNKGQQKLILSKVLIVGLGGLGSPAALYLAAAGIGELWLADNDKLHISNLQRQILYHTQDVSQLKVTLAAKQLNKLNPQIKVKTFNNKQHYHSLLPLVRNTDLVLDCTDNMSTRQVINAACVAENKSLISGSAIGFNGQLLVLEPPYNQGCYACLYPDTNEPNQNCRTAGVVGPIVGVIGTLQALEAVKLLINLPSSLNGKLKLFDGKKHSWHTLQLNKAKSCLVCGTRR
ncbi:Sulfur carrier protein ThiS adenylyltransferase [Arsenophonus endosymbiont of Aleurodicus dispersus]|uniref:HesA/MoeB/ThiF family protein n=1 Tax=Arsenophonus endosymbiont of Aleurodicus dispersus TaxID=235559 RepID=UPI000EB44C56|nr:HesA/MoeB/ThiF family protein [Arsenophonus endosymbiont of Aleurodicus dispersus]VAY02488.1 Sulfur carrier protein ThiS adenylyltransferase [Arsenophonus endosymbiont of Aleurodicus dispersus]